MRTAHPRRRGSKPKDSEPRFNLCRCSLSACSRGSAAFLLHAVDDFSDGGGGSLPLVMRLFTRMPSLLRQLCHHALTVTDYIVFPRRFFGLCDELSPGIAVEEAQERLWLDRWSMGAMALLLRLQLWPVSLFALVQLHVLLPLRN